MQWDIVIGLEIHVQLATKTKIFSGSSTAYGAEPNTQANALDLAMPGTLPVPNEQAFRYAVMFGLAVNAEIERRSMFERKNYFYPDLPKGYQTTQLERPIVGPGFVDIDLPNGETKRVRIHHAHLEEDAGKSLHEDFHGMTGVDLNRAGTPLLEIVTEPDFRNADQAVAYLKALHSLVTYLGISDGNMAEGSMRCDINISLREKGSETLGTRAEIKNVNSFRFVERAIHREVERQADILDSGGTIAQETRLYDAERDETRSMRSKEVANDYRYFPEPDLLPIEIDQAYIDAVRDSLPELPAAKRARLVSEYQLGEYDAALLVPDHATAAFFEEVARLSGAAKPAANWILGDLTGALNRADLTIEATPISAEALAGLIVRIEDGTLSSKLAKQVFEGLWQAEGTTDEIIAARGLKQVSDAGELEKWVDDVISANPNQLAQYLAADETKRKKLSGFFVGQIMKASKGQANPKLLNELLIKKLNDQS